MSDKCPKCNGAGVLRDATQAWDCGQEPPVCDFCGGEGTWMAADSRLAQAHARIAELEGLIEAWQEASLLSDSSGDPDSIAPHRLEAARQADDARIVELEAILEAIVAKLGRTLDGVPVTNGMLLWNVLSEYPYRAVMIVCADGDDYDEPCRLAFDECYANEDNRKSAYMELRRRIDAAEAAKEAKDLPDPTNPWIRRMKAATEAAKERTQ